MDGKNYTLSAKDMQLLRDIFFSIQEELAEKLAAKNFIQRRRKLRDSSALVHACYLYVVENLSFHSLANVMLLRHGISMSPAAWRKRLLKCADAFFEAALEMLQKSTCPNAAENMCFHAIDATDISKEGGKGTEIRMHCDFSMDSSSLSQIVQTDCHGAETIANFDLCPDNCYIADRAYGKTTQILHVMKAGAHFIFRVSPNLVRLYADKACKTKLNYQELMQNSLFETNCYVKEGRKSRMIRLIGSRIPEEMREKSRDRAKRTSVKKQRKITEATLQYAEWLFAATNLPMEYREEDIVALYYGRWQIELMFKRAKTLLNFHKIRRGLIGYSTMVTKLWMSITSIICCVQVMLEGNLHSDYSTYALFLLSKQVFTPVFP